MVVCFKPTGAVPPPEGTPTADLDQHGGGAPSRRDPHSGFGPTRGRCPLPKGPPPRIWTNTGAVPPPITSCCCAMRDPLVYIFAPLLF